MGVSLYWQNRGKTEADKREGRTFIRSDGRLACDMCCFKDRECDTRGHFHRESCPYCLGTGINASGEIQPKEENYGQEV